MSDVKPVRTVSPWSIGGGGSWRDLFTLPPWMHITGNILMTLFRHPFAVASVAMAVCGFTQWGWWGLALFFLPMGFLVLQRFVVAYMHSEVKNWRLVIKGMWMLRRIRKMWPHVMREVGMTGKSGDVAPFGDAQVILNGIRLRVVTGAIAKHSSGLQKKSADIAAGFFCSRALVKTVAPALAELSLQWGQHLRQLYRIHDLPLPGVQKKITFGINEDGLGAELVSNLSVLAGGMSGSGKSSFVWAYIAGYLRAGIPIRLRILDPSGIEFAAFAKAKDSPILVDYLSGTDSKDQERFWQRQSQSMTKRLQAVEASGVREHVPTLEEPLDITIVDEILPIAAELRKGGTDHPAGVTAYLGRKAGFVLVALTQASQVDVLGRIRDLFPQALMFRSKNRFLTDAVLGDGAESDGARASLLDVEHDRGVGYMPREGSAGYVQFRSAFVPDKEVAMLASGQLPIREIPGDSNANRMSKPHVLYAFFGAEGQWLYVGMTVEGRHETRWAEHSREKPWWPEVADKKIIDHLPDGYLAETAEALAIRKHKPKYNKTHNKQNPDRVHVPSQRGL